MKQETKARIGIYALTLLAMSSLGITPSIGLIMVEFPDAGATAVQQLTGIPNLMGIVSAVIFSAVATKVPRKVLAIAAPLFIAVGGLLPVVVSGGLPFLLVCSGILGLGVGLVTNTANTLITDLLPVDKQEAAMSQNVIFVNVGSIIMTMGGGMLSAGGWRNNYLVYLVAVPVLVLVLLCIPWQKVAAPEDAASQSPSAEREASASQRGGLGLAAVVAVAAILVYNGVYSTFPNNISLILTEGGLGDSSLAGMVTAFGTLGGIVAGITLGFLFKYIQRFSLALGLGAMGAAMIVLGFAQSLPIVLGAAFVIGYVLSIGFAQSPFVISIGTTPYLIPLAMGLYSAGSSLGGFVSPVVMNALSGAFMGGTATGCCVAAGAIALIACLVLLITGVQARVVDKAFSAPQHD